MTSWPFDTVLIANRGEIALRILRTVQALGLRAVVVHHALDRLSPAVAHADQAIELRGSTPVAAYLDGDAIVAAEGSGSDARVQVKFAESGAKWLMLAVAKLTPIG